LKLAITSVVPAPRDRVFAALIDPAILQRSIPGCASLQETAPDVYEATLKIGVAGLKGRYAGKASVRDKRPPESLTLDFDGSGGAGFVRGSAVMTIAPGETDEFTRVDCVADVQVGGVIAAVGSRLVEAAAKKLADDFFRQLTMQLLLET
jgi:carbon monoxide dehydrogenase subunit G